jgi:hypothetical protein
MAYAPHTADWVLNSFNTNITPSKLKHGQQHSNNKRFKSLSSWTETITVTIGLPIPQYCEILIAIFLDYKGLKNHEALLS